MNTYNPVVSGQTLVANAVALTTGVSANVLGASIVLNPGRWLIQSSVNFIFAATTSVTVISFGAGTVPATLPTVDGGLFKQTFPAIVPAAAQTWVAPASILDINVVTSYFLVASATFTVSTLTASGILTATQLLT